MNAETVDFFLDVVDTFEYKQFFADHDSINDLLFTKIDELHSNKTNYSVEEFEKEEENIINYILEFLNNNKEEITWILLLLKYFCDIRPKYTQFLLKIINHIFTLFSSNKSELIFSIERIGNYRFSFSSFYKLLSSQGILTREDDDNNLFPTYFLFPEQNSIKSFIIDDDVERFKDYQLENVNLDIFAQNIDRKEYPPWLNRNNPKVSLLDFAAICGSIYIFKYFLMNGFQPSSKSCKYAICGGNFEIIHVLEQLGLSYDEQCFITSIKYHRYILSNWLLTNHEYNEYPLRLSIECSNFKAFLFFIIKGADPYELYEFGVNESTLHIAASSGSLPIVKYLIINKNIDKDIVTEFGYTPLYQAVSKGHLHIVKYLIENQKVDINKKDSRGRNVMHTACFYGHLPVIRYLIQETDVEKNAPDNAGVTPLHIVEYERRQPDVVKYLSTVIK